MAKVRLTLLGGFSLQIVGSGDCTPPSSKARGLIAIVALSPNFALTHDRICGLLWSDWADAQARDSLKHALADIRKRLAGPGAEWIQSDQGEIRFSAESMSVDVREFQALLAKATEADEVHPNYRHGRTVA